MQFRIISLNEWVMWEWKVVSPYGEEPETPYDVLYIKVVPRHISDYEKAEKEWRMIHDKYSDAKANNN